MNDKPDRLRPEVIDRLVDGELSPREYREVLAALDQEPGGWRVCAMAFLESQALAGELGAVRGSPEVSPAQTAPVRAAPVQAAPPRQGLNARTWVAMAASFALVFALGVALPDAWRGVTQEPPAAGNFPEQNHVAGLGGWVDPAADAVRHHTFRPVANARLVLDEAAGGQTLADEVPVYETDQNLAEYVEWSQPALDAAVLQWLQAHGHQVQVQVHCVPGRLEDGRPMYLPLEQYTITPVKRSY